MILLTSNSCPACIKLKNMLDDISESYTEKTAETIDKMLLKQAKGFPTLFYNSQKILSGAPGNHFDLINLLNREKGGLI